MKIVNLTKIKDKLILWNRHKSSERFWISTVDSVVVYLRINNFPEEPLYTFISEGEIFDLDDLPDRWIINS